MTEEEKDFQNIRDYIAGSEQAFNSIVRKYSQKIYWHARRMLGNHSDADEITQEVLIVLYEKLKTFEFKSSLYTWIYRITSNRCINMLRRQSIRNLFFSGDTDQEYPESGNDIVSGIENREKVQQLNRILQTLPAKQREVFILRHFDEMSYEEISKITGKSVGGLKANYFHALRKVMQLQEKDD
ncbi:MAG: RNA polymerase sigma factor [Bacteroidota bacterium]